MTEETPATPGSPPPSEAGRASFHKLLGIRPVAPDRGRGRLELVIEERHLRTLGIVHGGVTAALLDTVLGTAAASLAAEDQHVVTAQLNVHFIRPGRLGETLVATAEVIHAGRRTAVARGEIRTATQDLVASGSGTFFYLPHPRRTGGPGEPPP